MFVFGCFWFLIAFICFYRHEHYIFVVFVVLNVLWIQKKRYFLYYICWWLDKVQWI